MRAQPSTWNDCHEGTQGAGVVALPPQGVIAFAGFDVLTGQTQQMAEVSVRIYSAIYQRRYKLFINMTGVYNGGPDNAVLGLVMAEGAVKQGNQLFFAEVVFLLLVRRRKCRQRRVQLDLSGM